MLNFNVSPLNLNLLFHSRSHKIWGFHGLKVNQFSHDSEGGTSKHKFWSNVLTLVPMTASKAAVDAELSSLWGSGQEWILIFDNLLKATRLIFSLYMSDSVSKDFDFFMTTGSSWICNLMTQAIPQNLWDFQVSVLLLFRKVNPCWLNWVFFQN